VNVDPRRTRSNRGDDVDVVVAVELGMDAALETDFRGAFRFGLANALTDLIQGEQVGVTPQVQ